MNRPKKLKRREFLHLCLLTAGGAVLSACEQASSWQSTPTSLPVAKIELDSWQADAWAWHKEVHGRIGGVEACEAIQINVNGVDFPAALQDGRFSASVALSEGENKIIAICRKPDGQEEKSLMLHYYERLRKAPKAVIQIRLDGQKIILHGRDSQPAEAGGLPVIDHVWSARPDNPASLMIQGLAGFEDHDFESEFSAESITILPPQVDGEYYVTLQVRDQEGRQDTSTIYFVIVNRQPVIPDYDREHVNWVENAIVYGIVPGKFGVPAFKAITERLDDLADLGVTAVWLAPINVSPPGDYGYAVMDYFELNPAYGSKEDFHRMVQQAHARGIRVLMDFVPNHSSIQHPYFADTQKRGQESPYWDFYDRDENGNYTYYFNWDYLPNLNYDNPEVQRWMIEAFSYWVREFDVDGYRVDVAWGIKQRRPDFWPIWRRELKRIKPDLLLLAEASARDSYYFDNGYDVGYDWTNELGKWAWELVWDSYKNRLLAYNLDAALTNRPDGFHPDALIFRFLNNNDTNERFFTKYGQGMARVSTALLLALPGIPCIYTGDEIGAEFHPYQDSEPLDWEEKISGWRDYHKKLIRLRKEIPSLHSRLWKSLPTRPVPQEVYIFVRYLAGNREPVLVALNFSEEDANMEAEIPPDFQSMLSQGSLIDLLSDEQISVSPQSPLSVTIPALTARILSPVPETTGSG